MILGSAAGVVAIAKPPGLATQAPAGLPSVEAWLRSRLSPGSYVGVPHRLDRAVSGVLLMAVTPRAARQLSRQFERRRIAKTYLALVAADAALAVDETCEWRDFLAKVAGEPRGRLAEAGEPGAREAVTGVRVVARPGAGRLLLELTPVTGRMHQLRIQAAARRMPILGDVAYGSAEPFVPQVPSGGDGACPIALHARCIAYADPDTGLTVRIEAPLPIWWPAELRAAVGSCGS